MAMPVVCHRTFLINLMKILDSKASVIIDDNCKDLVKVKTRNGDNVQGLLPAVMHIVNGTASASGNKNAEVEAAAYQWTEYCLNNFTQTTAKTKVLNELNSFFCDKTFIINSMRPTVADIVLYVFLNELFRNLSFYEKEIYNNLSRWFKQIQHEANSKAVCPHVPFIKTSLYT